VELRRSVVRVTLVLKFGGFHPAQAAPQWGACIVMEMNIMAVLNWIM
jgi:hypothetical protein